MLLNNVFSCLFLPVNFFPRGIALYMCVCESKIVHEM